MSDVPPPAAKAPKPAAEPVNKGIKWVVLLIVLSLAWYLLADRFTPIPSKRAWAPLSSRWRPRWPGG